MSIGSRGYGAAIDRNIESFEAANPGITVEWLKMSDVPGESRKLYVTSFLAKSPTPDVFAIDVIWAGEFAQRGWLAPLRTLMLRTQQLTIPPLLSATRRRGLRPRCLSTAPTFSTAPTCSKIRP